MESTDKGLRDNSVQEYLAHIDARVSIEFMQSDQNIVERNVWNTLSFLGVPGYSNQRQKYADVDWVYDGVD